MMFSHAYQSFLTRAMILILIRTYEASGFIAGRWSPQPPEIQSEASHAFPMNTVRHCAQLSTQINHRVLAYHRVQLMMFPSYRNVDLSA